MSMKESDRQTRKFLGLGNKRCVMGCGVIVIVAGFLIAWNWQLAAARYGTAAMRQVVLCDWINQLSKLSDVQKRVLYSLLYENVGDPDAVGEALAVLNAHIQEDEDQIVRHLVYVAFTTQNPSDRRVALSGLQHVTPKHETVATAVFLYYLKHSDTSNNGKEALNASFCISGLVKFSYRDARPAIAQFTNNANKYLAETANQALLSLDAPPRSSR